MIPPSPPRSSCVDCGRVVRDYGSDDGVEERYMVTDDVWADAGLNPDGGCLCVGCLEVHLGRSLVPADLAPYPVNHPGMFRDTPRLAALKLAAREARS